MHKVHLSAFVLRLGQSPKDRRFGNNCACDPKDCKGPSRFSYPLHCKSRSVRRTKRGKKIPFAHTPGIVYFMAEVLGTRAKNAARGCRFHRFSTHLTVEVLFCGKTLETVQGKLSTAVNFNGLPCTWRSPFPRRDRGAGDESEGSCALLSVSLFWYSCFPRRDSGAGDESKTKQKRTQNKNKQIKKAVRGCRFHCSSTHLKLSFSMSRFWSWRRKKKKKKSCA